MKKTKFVFHEVVSKKLSVWIYKGKIIEIEFINFFLQGEFFKKGMSIKITLEDTMIRQEKFKNLNYSEIIFGDVNTKGKILDIEFIINPLEFKKFNIPNFDFQIDEFKIFFLVGYLGNMNKGNNKLAQETLNNTNQQNKEK